MRFVCVSNYISVQVSCLWLCGWCPFERLCVYVLNLVCVEYLLDFDIIFLIAAEHLIIFSFRPFKLLFTRLLNHSNSNASPSASLFLLTCISLWIKPVELLLSTCFCAFHVFAHIVLSLSRSFHRLSSLCAPHAVRACVCERATYVCSVFCACSLGMLFTLACVNLYSCDLSHWSGLRPRLSSP